MSTYLLLRSNKQSGPYTLDQMRSLGLKAYDLVWIEGKSAAWRYPGEVEEFKSFAPEVEEQPYDRFFKKSPPQIHAQLLARESTITESHTPNPAISMTATATQQDRHIYINRPAENIGLTKAQPSELSEKASMISEAQQATTSAESKSPEVHKAPVVLFPIREKNSSKSLEEKFSKPLDDIKKEYLENVLYRKKDSERFRVFATAAAVVIAIIGLFSAGVFIGLSMNKGGINSTPKEYAKEEPGANIQPPEYHSHTIPVSTSLPQEQNNNKVLSDNGLLNESQAGTPKNNVKELTDPEKKKPRIRKEKALALSNVLKNRPAGDSDASVLNFDQRQAIHRTDASVAKDAVKNNIANYIFISSNKYSVGTFGGISELQLTVSNRSLYPIDLVVAEVQYVQANKKVFKTENLYFHNIGAGSALMMEAPKSPRGIKVQYKITVINSKELGLSSTGT